MFDRITLCGLAAASLIITSSSAELTRKAEEGETRARTISSVRVLTVVDMAMARDGEEVSSDRMRGLDQKTTTTLAASMTDVFEKVAGGRATTMRRTYGDITGKSEREGGRQGGQGGGPGGGGQGGAGGPRALVSKLTGEDVIFTWNAEDEDYVAAFPRESKADAALLVGLVGDLEAAAFLPKEAVEVGGEWDVALDTIAFFHRPGGNLHLAPEESGDGGDDRRARFGRGMRGPDTADSAVPFEYSGRFKATLAEIVEVDGARIARIQLAFELEGRRDLADSLEPMTRETQDGGQITTTTLQLEQKNGAKGTGELRWDVARGAIVSLTVEAELEENEVRATETDFDGNSSVTEIDTTSEGTLKFEYRVE